MPKLWLKNYPERVPEKAEYPSVPLHHFLDDAALKYPQNPSMIFFGKKINYEQFKEDVLRVANGLIHLGVKKGDRISIYMPNCPQTIISYFAVLKAGGIVVETNPMYVERELEYQLNDSGAETILTLDMQMLYPRVKAVEEKTPLRNVVVGHLGDYLPYPEKALYPLVRWKDLAKVDKKDIPFKRLLEFPPSDPGVPVSPDEVAVLLYTGGTTGAPKGVMLTHRNLVANCVQGFHWLYDLKFAGEVILTALPVFHSFGHTCCMGFAVYSASCMVLIPDPRDTRDVLKNIQKHRATMFPGVPTMFVNIINSPHLAKYDISSVRFCFSGAAPLPVDVLETFERLTGGIIVEGFGMTETSPVTHINPILGARKIGSVGMPISDTEARVVDVETGEREMPENEVGELVVRGPQVMAGYWKDTEETGKVLKDGWMFTGDLATMDADGYFYIVGRKKDMIISSGFNVYPREIEEVLFEHPKVKEVSAIGFPHEKRGEVVKVFIVLKEGEKATEEEIRNYCKQNLAAYKVPKLVEFRDSLPKTPVGKVLTRQLREEEMGKRG